jgi:hypothetical protein
MLSEKYNGQLAFEGFWDGENWFDIGSPNEPLIEKVEFWGLMCR